MRSWRNVALGCFAVMLAAAGCQSRSHTSVRTYEYGREAEPQPSGQLESEYQMQSPGAMQSPGTMTNDPD